MNCRLSTALSATLSFVMVVLAPLQVATQSGSDTPMLTPDGQPDISGIFTFRTLTPLQRPVALEDRVTGFIPPHVPADGRVLQGLAGEGIAVDEDGNVFVAEGPASRPAAGGGLTKYVRQ